MAIINRLKIMLIDDEEVVRKAIAESISDIYDVFQYDCFSEAKAAIQKANPDIILMDVKNKQYNGHQFLEDLLKCGIQIPTVVVTGSDLTDRMVVQSVYYAQRMYTEEQIGTLGIEQDLTFKDTYKRLTQLEESTKIEKTIQPYFLIKPIGKDALRGYLGKIAKTIKK